MSEKDDKALKHAACPLPWMHFSVALETSVRVCCNTDHGGYVRREDGSQVYLSEISKVEDYYNLPSMKKLRADMMNGRRPDFCKSCYRTEENGGTSIRQIYLEHLGGELEEALERTDSDGQLEPAISYLDFSLGNHCNLKCRMCNPVPSESLRRDFEEEGLPFSRESADRARDGWTLTSSLKALLESQLPSAREILTTGGEPFLARQHRFLLEKAIETGRAPQILLRYHTNLTTLPDELIEAWKHFRRVEIHVSLEGFGPVNDYVRYPSQWAKIEKNLDRLVTLMETMSIYVEVHTCFQAYNLLRLVELFEFLRKYRGWFPILPYPILLTNPDYLQATALPPELRRLGIEKLRSYLAQHREELGRDIHHIAQSRFLENFEGHMRWLEEAPFDEAVFRQFLSYTEILDRRREQRLVDLQPEFARYLKT